MNPYESEKLLSEYLLFHYGSAEEILPYLFGPREALEYPARCAAECGKGARALDLGCAVGRSTFELARHFGEVIGVDYSQRFVAAANQLRAEGTHPYVRLDEGPRSTPLLARVPEGIERTRVRFEQGDAQELRADLGSFDLVLLANLIDRLREPRRCLARLPGLVKPGGTLVITSPYTWLEEYTPREHWLCGEGASTGEHLVQVLSGDFELTARKDLPFLIREHARKFQWSVAEATVWRRLA